jgi:hypothetical protein
MGPFELAFYRIAWKTCARARRAQVQSSRQIAAPTERIVSFEPTPGDQVVVGLAFARVLDAYPPIARALATGGPVLTVEIPDQQFAKPFKDVWPLVAFGPNGHSTAAYQRSHSYVIPPPPRSVTEVAEEQLCEAIVAGNPVVVLTTSPERLPAVIADAETARIRLFEFDPELLGRAIRAVAGRRTGTVLSPQDCAGATATALAALVRFDRTADDIVDLLKRRARARSTPPGGLALHDLHGMPAVRDWADSMLRDLAGWRRGDIQWSEVDSKMCMVGPPGVGKTQAARSIAAAANLPLLQCTYGAWQSVGEAHLGTTLREMRASFAQARVAPCCLHIDELDSFGDRSGTSGGSGRKYDNYMVSVVNALLTEIDSIVSRPVVLIGSTNSVERCDPALLRPSRFSRIVRIGIPSPEDIEPMLRVRLGHDLTGQDLGVVARYAAGKTGAEIEQAVSDARRAARADKRALQIADLVGAFGGRPVGDAARTKRIAVHEGGHLLASVVLNGSSDLTATLSENGGAVRRYLRGPALKTYEDYHRSLQVMLAGRAAEEMVLGAPSDGAVADLEAATAIASSMVGSVGLAGGRLLHVGHPADTVAILSYPDLRRAADAEIRRASHAVTKLLAERRTSLDEIAAQLVREGHMDGRTAAGIIRRNSIEEFELAP